MPSYNFLEFQADCADSSKIHVWPSASEDADKYFGLGTKEEICDFIIDNDETDFFQFINSALLDKKPKGQINDAMVDAYSFEHGTKSGYLAFYRGQTGKWIIKSFHLHSSSPLTYNPLAIELMRRLSHGS